MNAEKPKARQSGEVQRHGELSVALKAEKRQNQAVSWTANITESMSMKNIRLDVDVGQIAKGKQMLGYEVSKIDSRGNEIEKKRYVATTCSHANRTSSCSVLAFLLAGRRGLSYLGNSRSLTVLVTCKGLQLVPSGPPG